MNPAVCGLDIAPSDLSRSMVVRIQNAVRENAITKGILEGHSRADRIVPATPSTNGHVWYSVELSFSIRIEQRMKLAQNTQVLTFDEQEFLRVPESREMDVVHPTDLV